MHTLTFSSKNVKIKEPKLLRLREERQARGWTLLDVAYRTGIGQTAVSEIERGLRKPYPVWGHRLSKLFKLSIEDLLKEVPDE